MGDISDQRAVCHGAFVCEALDPPAVAAPPGAAPAAADPAAAALGHLRAALRRLWQRVKWEPRHKEVFWRLAVDGIGMPGTSHLPAVPLEPCACGAHPPAAAPGALPASPRLHHFWACELLAPLRAVLEAGVGCGVRRMHLWLCRSPDPEHARPCVWDVVALAALNAMEWARRQMHARRLHGGVVADAVAAGAVAKFWTLLHDFAGLGVPRKGWGAVGADHPFLRVVGGVLVCAEP